MNTMVAKTTSNRAKKPNAWIVSPNDKGRKSIKNGKVFLNNGDYFEIELFNPLTECILADIKLNDQSICKTGLLVKPGQRFYLDCFVDDKKKFVFNTYNIESKLNSIEAIEKNGLLEVFFYKEAVVSINNWQNRFRPIVRWYPTYPTYPSYPSYPTTPNLAPYYRTYTNTHENPTTGSINLTGSFFDRNKESQNIQLINCGIETGRVEKGESSSQTFSEIDMDFESNYISSTIIEILPESVKPIEYKEITKIDGKLTPIKLGIKSESDELIDLIKKLSDLHSNGILTDDEFTSKKLELLSKI